jgi:hypothetical protein
MGLGPQIMSQSNSMGLGPQVSPSGYNPYQGQTTQPQGAYNPANIASNANAGLAGMMSTNSPLYSQLMGLTGTTTQSANQQWNALGQQGNQTMNTANAALGQAQQNMGNYNALQSQNMSSLQNAMQTANTATQYANMSNMASNPAYQFELQQGQNAIQNSAAANGGFFSGQTGTALANYSEGLAATYAPQLASQMQSLAENPLQNQLTAQSGLQGLQTNALSPYTQLLGAQGTVQGQQYNTLNPVSQMTGLSQGVQGNTLGENQTVTNSLQSGQTNQNNNLTNLFNSASPYITGGISGTSQGLTNLQSILQALSSQGAGIPATTANLAAGYSTMAPAYTSAGLNSLGNTAMGTANLINQGSYTYDTGVSDSDAQNALLYSQQQQTNPTAMSFINSIF